MWHRVVDAHLLVLLKDEDRLFVVGHLLGYYLCSIGSHLDTTEVLFDHGLGMVDIDVANDDDGLVVWAVPLLVIGTKCGRLETVDDAHQSDRHALTIL